MFGHEEQKGIPKYMTVESEGGTTKEEGAMLVTTLAIVNPALSSHSAIEEIGANTVGARAKVPGVAGGDAKTTRVDEGGGVRG